MGRLRGWGSGFSCRTDEHAADCLSTSRTDAELEEGPRIRGAICSKLGYPGTLETPEIRGELSKLWRPFGN